MKTKTVIDRMMKLADENPPGTPGQLAALGYVSWGEACRAQLDGMDEYYPDLYDFCYCLDIRDEVDMTDRDSAAEDVLCYCRRFLDTRIARMGGGK